MPPRGALSDKIGNRYEGRIAVWRLLQLLDEQHDSVQVRFEHPGDDHFEWWVQRTDGSRIYTQVKRQQAPDKEWSTSTLVSRGVLTAFGERLGGSTSASCEFVSTLSASHLQDLTESARMATSLAEFEAEFADSQDKQASWNTICGAWGGITREQVRLRLRRITVRSADEWTLQEVLRIHARALVAGPPEKVVSRLGDYLDDHLAHELTALDVWEFLRNEGWGPTDWGGDSSVYAAICSKTKQYRDGIVIDRGPLAEIRRAEALKLAELVTSVSGPAVVTVAADAGLGKTGLLGQILDALDARDAEDGTAGERPLVLAARLDRLSEFTDASSLGGALGLPGPPAAVLSRVAAGRPALLVLDQVDAFGAGSGRNPARLEAVAEVLREAGVLSVRVLLACRAFDLDVDLRLAELAGISGPGGQAEGHHMHRLGPLPAVDVDQTLRDADIDSGSLTPSLRELLKIPLHLRMLVTLQQRGQIDPGGINTRLQLFDSFSRSVIHEVESRQSGAPVAAVTDRLTAALSERQELSIPAAMLSDYTVTVDHLVSAGWLRRDAGRIAFAHEAFFDFAYAQRHIRSGQSLLALLRSGEQHLFRRGQVRQILTLEREQDRRQYLRDVRDALAAGDVRPHLKELVLTLVTRVPDPAIEEWQALGALGDATGNPLAERVHSLAAQAPAFSRLLLAEHVLAGYLSEPATADLGAWLCQLLMRAHPDEVADLLMPYVGRPGWARRLARVLNAAPYRDSDRAADLMEAAIGAGDLDDAIRALGSSSDFFSLLHELNGPTAGRGSRLVAAWLRRRLTLLAGEGAYQLESQQPEEDTAEADSQGDTESADDALLDALHDAEARRLIAESMSAPEILATLAADDPVAFAKYILPVVREAAAASRTGEVDIYGERDQALPIRPSQHPEHSPADALLSRIAQAIQAAADAGDENVHAAVRQMAISPLATEQVLAATGFAAGHPDLLDDAVSWLETGPYALAQGWFEDLHGLSAAVIAQVCTQLPAERTEKIQERAADYTNDFERHERRLYGGAAHRLLHEIPTDRITSAVRARRDELNRKFPPRPAPPPFLNGAARDPSVQSPISFDAVQKMNDNQLIGTMRRWDSEEWEPLADGRLRGGATSVAQVVGAAAQADPDRFLAVLESLPEDIPAIYIQHILSGLQRSAAGPGRILHAIKAAQARLSMCRSEIAWLIGHVAPHLDDETLQAAGLPMATLLSLLEQLLTQRAEPAPASDRPAWDPADRSGNALDAGNKLADELTSRLLNQPEYPALQALATLAQASPQATEMLAAQLTRLSASPYLSLRALAIDTAARTGQDPPTVITIITTALETNCMDSGGLPTDAQVLLASHQLRNLLLQLSWPHYDLITPILDRMLAFSTRIPPDASAGLTAAATQAAHNAAMITTTAAYQHPEAAERASTLAQGSAACRRGITVALAQVLPLNDLPGELTGLLTQVFDDPDDEIARLAGTSLRNIPLGNDDLAHSLLSAAARARTFTLAPQNVIFATEHYQGHIPATILDIAERFFRIHSHQAGDPSSHGFHDGSVLGRLVVTIYQQEHEDSQFTSRALDLIDAMILARTYGLEDLMTRLDR